MHVREKALSLLISADDHLDLYSLPPSLWTERVPRQLQARAPRVVETDQGAFWEVEGARMGTSGRPAANIKYAVQRAGISDDHFRPAKSRDRLGDMDLDGVQGTIIYGPSSGFAVSDPDLKVACLSAYNDWAAEFSSADRKRLFPLGYLPTRNVNEAITELRRIARIGLRGAVLAAFDMTPFPWEEEWEPLFRVAGELNMPISFHLAAGLWGKRPGEAAAVGPSMTLPMQLDEVLAGMLCSGILDRNPDTKIVLAEAGLGWIAYLLERLDSKQRHGRFLSGTKELRSEIFRRQVFVTFEEDNLGLQIAAQVTAHGGGGKCLLLDTGFDSPCG
jgi:predicted TIM-barrel fold metal-dependent hydrolase